MTIITKIFFSHPDMALADTITSLPEVTVRVMPEAGTDPEHNMNFFLVRGGTRDALDAAFEADHTVEEAHLTSEQGDQRLYGVIFTEAAKLVAPTVTEVGGISLEARSGDGGWVERWQLPDRQALNTVWEHARERSFRFDVLELYQIDDTEFGETFGLTDEQREALMVAYTEGYFKEPRDASLVDLAEELGISPTAASGRLRRGLTKLVGATIVEQE
ncbi:helix-turn-helix domain-containing protein [Halobacteriaceae archaeon GCM10025711]